MIKKIKISKNYKTQINRKRGSPVTKLNKYKQKINKIDINTSQDKSELTVDMAQDRENSCNIVGLIDNKNKQV